MNNDCPNCGIGQLNPAGEIHGGFSVLKAILGFAVAGPVGIITGMLGKKKRLYKCNHCGYFKETF